MLSHALRQLASLSALVFSVAAFPGATLAHPVHGVLRAECPGDYQVHPGLNVNFPSDGMMRAFIVTPPSNLSKPVPVWVPLTGSVESTEDNLHSAHSGANALMADKGFMVIGPIRECANQDPKLSAGVCNGPGVGGWNWRPWFEGRSSGPAGDRWKTDEGPDSRFFRRNGSLCSEDLFPGPQAPLLGGNIVGRHHD